MIVRDYMDISLSTHEYSALLSEIYDAALSGEWNTVLNTIIEVTNSNKAFFYLKNINKQSPYILEFKATFQHSSQTLMDFQQRIGEDPYYKKSLMATEGEIINGDDIVNVKDIEDTEYYKSILFPMKSHFILASVLIRDDVHDSCLVLNRGKDQVSYNKKDIDFLNLVTPHISRAMHIYKELRLYKNYSNISKSILDQDNKAIVVCDQHGIVLLSNRYANMKLTSPSPVSLDAKSLKIENALYHKKLNFLIKQCATLAYNNIGTQETLLLERAVPEEDNILITVSPLVSNNELNDIDVPCCLVTVTFQQQLHWQNIKVEFGLTAKELLLLKAIYGKKKLNELTSDFNVSYNTLRTHLQSIFRKTAVNSQTELMIKINLFK